MASATLSTLVIQTTEASPYSLDAAALQKLEVCWRGLGPSCNHAPLCPACEL